MRLSSVIGWAFLVAGCASQSALSAPTATPPKAVATPQPNAEHSVETSHVFLLTPGKDAVRIVVSR